MTMTVLAISAAYVVLGVLLILMSLKAPMHWRWKALAIVVSTVLFVEVFFQTKGLLGWPGVGKLPDNFQLLWARVVEPDARASEPGAIYMWVEEIDSNNIPVGVPRAFRLPYVRMLADKALKARDQIMEGNPQAGTADNFAGDQQKQDNAETADQGEASKEIEGASLSNSEGLQKLDIDSLMQAQQVIEFKPMPTALLPAKKPQ